MYISRMKVQECNYTYKEHILRRQVTVAPARRTDSRRVLLDNTPVDGQTNGRIYTGYCPVSGRSRACPIGFVSTRFLSKDVSYTISITCHIASSLSFPPSSFLFPYFILFSPLFEGRRIAPCLLASIKCRKRPDYYVEKAYVLLRVIYIYIFFFQILERLKISIKSGKDVVFLIASCMCIYTLMCHNKISL